MSFGSPNNPYGQPQDPQQAYGYPQAPQGIPPQQGYGYPQQPGFPGGDGPRLASMGRRCGARAIDVAVFFVVYLVVAGAGVAGLMDDVKKCDPNASDYQDCVNNASSDFVGKFMGILAVLWIFSLLYEVLMTSLAGGTLGKLAVGIRVVKADTGQKAGLGASIIRWIIPIVGSFVCGIGQLIVYLSPFWDNAGRLQGWHDKAASTMVVHK
ncbi:RDD family protein [Streptomyces sp. NBC_00820]|uniref:RDD family protein n=1 Tax=Streptomyces sp. NBC_00820 TaxID=2975842 RepID=UPI002ED5190E|nr:RDD family protein [Streptomyces sp. NBC_00820]